MNAIETSRLTKKYGAKAAVDALDLTVREGELFGLLGVNGAGKTTTVKMLSCLISPDAGDALLLGDSIVKNPAAVKAKTNVSPQETAVAPNLSVRENLELIARIYGFNGDDAKTRATEMIDKFGLTEYKKSKAKTLSGGTQRRLSIGMALISEPKILFLDEPTLGLDVIARRELWDAVEQLRGRVTVILTTHYMEEAEALCDRIAVMARGRLCAVGTVDELNALAGCDKFEESFIKLATGKGETK